MSPLHEGVVPYGAAYFRYTNPPEEDWERDYAQAAKDGMNTFRHWFIWSGIQRAPERWDWSRYDRQFDLAADNGIKTIIAEFVDAPPEWAYRQYAHARYQAHDGYQIPSSQHGSAAIGGRPGLCLSHPGYRELAGNFLNQLANRYKDHPSMGGYDVWNECNWHPGDTGGGRITQSLYIPTPATGSQYRRMYCYCHECKNAFRDWLRNKYGDLDTLADVWRRYGYSEWDDIEPPASMYDMPECIDWLAFRNDWAYALMQWRIDTIKSADPVNPVVAHGIAWTLAGWASTAMDDWRAAEKVDAYGFTWAPSRKGLEPWKQFHAVDLVRGASRGKPFWHSEAPAGPLWMQAEVARRPRDDGRIPDAEDFRLMNFVSLAGGTRGTFAIRWRALLHGPLQGAFGLYNDDGTPNEKSEMAALTGAWITAEGNRDVRAAMPVKGDIGILVIGDSQFHNVSQKGDANEYAESYRGTYRGFFENNIQPDFVKLEDIDEYDAVYLSYPVHLESATAEALIEWVRNGGVLVSEGCPGYWGDAGRVHPNQPGYGLDELFGVRQSYVELVPDLLAAEGRKVSFRDVRGNISNAAGDALIYRQEYETTTGRDVGTHEDTGGIAIVENEFGDGRTLLIGTFPGTGFMHSGSPEGRRFFEMIAKWVGVDQHVVTGEADAFKDGWGVTARLHEGDGKRFLWITNPGREQATVGIALSESTDPIDGITPRWGGETATLIGERLVSVTVGGRDASVLQLT